MKRSGTVYQYVQALIYIPVSRNPQVLSTKIQISIYIKMLKFKMLRCLAKHVKQKCNYTVKCNISFTVNINLCSQFVCVMSLNYIHIL